RNDARIGLARRPASDEAMLRPPEAVDPRVGERVPVGNPVGEPRHLPRQELVEIHGNLRGATLRRLDAGTPRVASLPHSSDRTSSAEARLMPRYIDLSVTVDDTTLSPPSTNMRLEVTPHRRGPGFWQVSSVHQSLHTGAHIDSPLHVFRDGITTAEITLDQVMGEALVVDLSFAGPNHAITIDDLKRGGADGVKEGDIVLLRTDWPDEM